MGDEVCAREPKETSKINLDAALKIARICKKNRISQFIFASTCSVYGTGKDNQLLTELSIPNPVSLYGETKLTAEKKLLKLATEYFQPTIIRPASSVGISPRMRFDIVANYFAMKTALDEQVDIYDGDQWRPFSNIGDTARAVLFLAELPQEVIGNQIINIGSSTENYKLKQIIPLLKALAPHLNCQLKPEMKDQRSYRVSFRKLENLGFKSKRNLFDGLQEVYKAVKRGKIDDIKNEVYYN